MNTFRHLGLAAILMTTTGLVEVAHAASMQEAVAKAISTHPEVLEAEKNRNAIGHQIDMAKAGYKPTVDIQAGTGYEQSMNSSTRYRAARAWGDPAHRDMWRSESRLTVRQMVFDGWKTKSQVAQQQNRFTSADFHAADIRNSVAIRAVSAYLNVLRTRELVALAEGNLANHQSYVEKIKARTAGGRSPEADIRQASGRMALAQANVEAAKGDQKKAEADYLEAVGEMPASPVKDATPFAMIPASPKAAVDVAMQNSPVISGAMANIKAANAQLAESKSAFCPRVDLEGMISRNYNLSGVKGVNNDATAMVVVSENLYRGGYDKAQRLERIEYVKASQDSLEKERRSVERAVLQAYADMETAKNRLQPLAEHVQDATSTRDAYAAQFNIGQRTLLDLLDSEVELYNSQAALIDGKYQTDLAAYAVLANTGQLVPANPVAVASK